MKSIEEFIKESASKYKLPDKNGFRTLEEFCDINNIDINNITEEQIDFYYTWNWNSYYKRNKEQYYLNIYETLKSHNVNNLINKINNEFKDVILDCNIVNNENSINSKSAALYIKLDVKNVFIKDINIAINDNTLDNNIYSKKLYSILNFFNYYITTINNDFNKILIFIEPVYTDNVTNKVLKNGGYIYHITLKNNWKYIQNTGLRPRVGKIPKEDGYRYFPKRLYFIANDKDKESTLISIKNTINDKEYDINDIVLLKININEHHIGLFIDTASVDKNAVYTYESIPSKLIEKINIKDYENKI